MADIEDGTDGEDYLGRTVYEADPGPVPTGLCDKYGNELFAMDERTPIGYVHPVDKSD